MAESTHANAAALEDDDAGRSLHALRNALGAIRLSLSIARRALATGDTGSAALFLEDAHAACEHGCALLANLARAPDESLDP